jgi:hypothetical protein
MALTRPSIRDRSVQYLVGADAFDSQKRGFVFLGQLAPLGQDDVGNDAINDRRLPKYQLTRDQAPEQTSIDLQVGVSIERRESAGGRLERAHQPITRERRRIQRPRSELGERRLSGSWKSCDDKNNGTRGRTTVHNGHGTTSGRETESSD